MKDLDSKADLVREAENENFNFGAAVQ
jgi:hypothetical protein